MSSMLSVQQFKISLQVFLESKVLVSIQYLAKNLYIAC